MLVRLDLVVLILHSLVTICLSLRAQLIIQEGYAPDPRSAVATFQREGHSYLFGGKDQFGGIYNDLYINDPEWITLNQDRDPIGDPPGEFNSTYTPSYAYKANGWVTEDGDLWLFSGEQPYPPPFDELWMYRANTSEWAHFLGCRDIDCAICDSDPSCRSKVPHPQGRGSAATWMTPDGCLHMYAGHYEMDNIVSVFGDHWRLNTTSLTWQLLAGVGNPNRQTLSSKFPGLRYGFAFWGMPDGTLYLYGGLSNIILTDTWMYHPISNWTKLTVPLSPPGRAGPVTWKGSNGELYLFGGQLQDGVYSDFWKFNIYTRQWSQMSPDPEFASFNVDTSGWIASDGSLRLFAGVNSTHQDTNDLYSITLPSTTLNIAPSGIMGGYIATVNASEELSLTGTVFILQNDVIVSTCQVDATGYCFGNISLPVGNNSLHGVYGNDASTSDIVSMRQYFFVMGPPTIGANSTHVNNSKLKVQVEILPSLNDDTIITGNISLSRPDGDSNTCVLKNFMCDMEVDQLETGDHFFNLKYSGDIYHFEVNSLFNYTTQGFVNISVSSSGDTSNIQLEVQLESSDNFSYTGSMDLSAIGTGLVGQSCNSSNGSCVFNLKNWIETSNVTVTYSGDKYHHSGILVFAQEPFLNLKSQVDNITAIVLGTVIPTVVLISASAALAWFLIFKKRRNYPLQVELPTIPTVQVIDMIEPSEIVLGRVIGEGSFGRVYQAQWGDTTVALKSIKSGDDDVFVKQEAALVKSLNHPNVLRFYGLTEIDHVSYMVTEFCRHGDLINYLSGKSPTELEKLNMASNIANGLHYLHTKKIVHRDLAIRNILVGEGSSPIFKVADFGLSKKIDSDDTGAQETKIPIRWSAPEVLSEAKFSALADVWSFGIVLWEIWENGRRPYPDIFTNDEVYHKVMAGHHPNRPDTCPDDVWKLMEWCFKKEPEERPAMIEAISAINKARLSRGVQEEDVKDVDLSAVEQNQYAIITPDSKKTADELEISSSHYRTAEQIMASAQLPDYEKSPALQ